MSNYYKYFAKASFLKLGSSNGNTQHTPDQKKKSKITLTTLSGISPFI